MSSFQMISTTLDGITSLFTIGGYPVSYLLDIFRLECSGSGTVASSCTWEPYEKFKLQVARRHPAVIPLSDNFAHKICNTGMSRITFLPFVLLFSRFQNSRSKTVIKKHVFISSLSG